MNHVFSQFVHQLYNKYPKGFYVYIPEESRITNKQKNSTICGQIY